MWSHLEMKNYPLISSMLLFCELCYTLWRYPMDCNPPAPLSIWFSIQKYFPDKNSGIFLTQGLNPGLLHCRKILYHLSHEGSPISNIECQLINGIIGDPQRSKNKYHALRLNTWIVYRKESNFIVLLQKLS